MKKAKFLFYSVFIACMFIVAPSLSYAIQVTPQGNVKTFVANEALSHGDVVYVIAASKYVGKADTDLAIAAYGIVCGPNVASGGNAAVAMKGSVLGDSSLTTNGAIYLTATAGSYDQTGVAAFKQTIGHAISATEWTFDIDPTYTPVMQSTTGTFSGPVTVTSSMTVTGISADGSTKPVIVKDSGAVEVASVDTDGNFIGVDATFSGDVAGLTLTSTGDVAGTTGTYSDDITIATGKALNVGTEQVVAENGIEGISVRRVATVVFDYSDQATAGTFNSGTTIPDNAVITGFGYDVTTTFTGNSDDSSTIAISVESANDMVSAVAISNGGNPWDSGMHEGVPQPDDASTWVKTTSAQTIDFVITVGTETNLTAGSMYVWIEYIVTQ